MSKRRKRKRRDKLPLPQAAKPRFPGAAGIFLAVAVVASLGFWWWTARSAEVSTAAKSTTEANAAATSSPEFQNLKGQWRRPDGGYVLAIKDISAGGAMDAAYFNPNSIHVAKAQASREGDTTRVFIELRDVNYPGSTYTLTYDPASDQLKGIYYQAVERQRFDVVFARLK